MKIYAHTSGLWKYQADPANDRLLDKFLGKDIWFYAESYGWVKLLEKYTVYNTMYEDDIPYYRFLCISPAIADNLATQDRAYRERILSLLPNDEKGIPIYLVDKYWYPALRNAECLTTEELFRLGES